MQLDTIFKAYDVRGVVPDEFDKATFKEIYGEDAQPASNTGF